MAKENLIGHQKFKFKLTKEGQTILKVEVEGHNFAVWKFGNWQLWQFGNLEILKFGNYGNCGDVAKASKG